MYIIKLETTYPNGQKITSYFQSINRLAVNYTNRANARTYLTKAEARRAIQHLPQRTVDSFTIENA